MIDWKTRTDLVGQIKKHEGIRLTPYRCTAGKLTIGIGRNLDDVGITELEAELMCLHDLDRCQQELDRNIKWWRQMSEKRQMVLLDMCFNLGIGKLVQFQKTLQYARTGAYLLASEQMMKSRWAQQVKGRATTLAEMMKHG